MNAHYVSYPKINMHLLDYGLYTYMNLKFTYDGMSYLAARRVNKNKLFPDMRLLLQINKISLLHSTFLCALNKFEDGESKYKPPPVTARNILKKIGAKYCGLFSIEVYTDEF